MNKKIINTKKAQTFYREAKSLIPGGTMLFSKKPELHLPNLWPNYFSKVKDCYIWDVSGNKYIDMMFYVGTNILGYSNKKIDNEVIKFIKKGNLSTLNNSEEITLAKKFSLRGVPTTILFNKQGEEFARIVGSIDFDNEKFINWLKTYN